MDREPRDDKSPGAKRARYDRAVRIISLQPAATELLALLGAENLLVGRSHACDHPRSITHLPVLTGPPVLVPSVAGNDGASSCPLDEPRLEALRPDLIVSSSLGEVPVDEGRLRTIAVGMSPIPKVLNQDPRSIEAVYEDLLALGEAVGREARADAALVELRDRYWSAIDYVNPYVEGPQVAFLTSLSPLGAGGWWIPHLIESAGGRCGLNAAGQPPRAITPEDLVASMPERLIIGLGGSDPLATSRALEVLERSNWWGVLPAVLDDAVVLVKSPLFDRPGPRLFDAFRWLVGWLNDRPELVPPDFPVRAATAAAWSATRRASARPDH